ncbi:hypothetical protein ACHAXR_004274 [Thalassiosira sp. AJA248-18]
MAQNKPPSKLHAIIHSQKQTLHLFLSHPPTRTPTIVLYVASFGGALHAAVTTYFYLAIGASEMDIGQFGFIMSVGALVGSPISGLALDRYGPWIPISVTATACTLGCLWRGFASSLPSLRLGAILLGIGVNMWTVVLGHLVKSFPSSMRSEVLSGFGVQMTIVQLFGKGIFPLVEYGLHHIVGLEDSLLRYRIHMGMCTFFCFYGTFALFWDKKNVQSGNLGAGKMDDIVKYQQKHSDVVDDLEECSAGSAANIQQSPSLDIHAKEIELGTASNKNGIHPLHMSYRDSSESFMDNSINTSSSSFLNEPEPSEHEATSRILITEDNHNITKSKQFGTTITLTFALLVQSISTTILTVLWPLLAHDRFGLSANTFGALIFISSIVSTAAVAAFPVVERLDIIGGRVRCAALGLGLGSILCLLFCFCSFYDYWDSGVEMNLIGTADGDNMMVVNGDTNDDLRMLEHDETIQRLQSRKQFLLHGFSAMAFQAALCFLEPSLKSILSIVVNSSSTSASLRGSSLGGTVGFMQTLGNIGGMIGNLAGMWMYKLSKDIAGKENDGEGSQRIFHGGSLPFVATAALMAVSSILIWRLEEPKHYVTADNDDTEEGECKTLCDTDVESGHSTPDGINSEPPDDSELGRPDGCCLAMRETTYDLKLD